MSRFPSQNLPMCDTTQPQNAYAEERAPRFRARLHEQEMETRIAEREHAKRLRESSLYAESDNFGGIDLEEPVFQAQADHTGSSDDWPYEDGGGYESDAYNEKVLYYALYVVHFGLSKEEILRMERLMEKLYGRAPPIRYETDVEPMMQKELSVYKHKVYNYCNQCRTLLEGSTEVCRNTDCSLYRVNVKRTKASQRVEVHVTNMTPQLEDIVASHLPEIVDAHGRIHNNANEATNRSDIRLFPGFAEKIETPEEFRNYQIRLLLTMSTDGFKAKRLTRRDMWPLYLRVDDLDVIESNRYENSILCEAIYGRNRPNDILIDNLLRVTPAMRIIAPSMFSTDALHVCSEGITKDRLRDIFSPATKFPELRVRENVMERIKHSLQSTSSHTYSNATILSLEDIPNCTGSELDEIAFAAIPVLAAVNAIPCPPAAASLLGYWLCLRIIAKTAWLTTNALEVAKSIAAITKSLWISMAPAIITMKCHWFFDHGIQEELDRYGTMYQWSSSPFESHHHRLQVRVNQSTTNSSAVIIEKYLLLKRIKNLAKIRAQDNDELRKLLEKVDNRHVTRLPVHIRIDDETYIPQGSIVRELLNEHQCFVRHHDGDIACSRLVVRGKGSRSSRQDLVFLGGSTEEEAASFGSILLFVCNTFTKSARVVLEEYNLSDPFDDLGNQVNQFQHPCRRLSLQLMRLIEEHNIFFERISTHITRVRDALNIMSPACRLDYGTESYMYIA